MSHESERASDPKSRLQSFQALREKLGSSLPPGPTPPASTPSSTSGSTPAKKLPRSSSERVTVRRERSGRGGKTVTIAEGPGLFGSDLDALAREAARALGVGARVEERTLVVQGDQSERFAAWLTGRGYTGVARGN